MAASEKFKQIIQSGNLHEALILAITQAMELKVTTKLSGEETPTDSKKYLQSRMSLLEGKIEHELSESFLQDSLLSEIQAFHTEQIASSSQLVQKNIQSLQKIFEVLIQIQQFNSQGSSPSLPSQNSSITLVDAKQERVDSIEESMAITPEVLPPETADSPPEILSLEDFEVDEDWEEEGLESEHQEVTESEDSETLEEWDDWQVESQESELDIPSIAALELGEIRRNPFVTESLNLEDAEEEWDEFEEEVELQIEEFPQQSPQASQENDNQEVILVKESSELNFGLDEEFLDWDEDLSFSPENENER